MRRVAFIVAFILAPVATSSFFGTGPRAHGAPECEPPKNPPAIHATDRGPAYFLQPRQSIRLHNGQKQIVPMNLFRPASNSKVDVFFIVDATQSMDFEICAVQKDITATAVALAKTGLDARYGLASFRDYPYRPWGQGKDDPVGYEGDYVYKLERSIAPLDFDFVDALHNVVAAGGGDLAEAGQAALYQALSGAGQVITPGQQSAGDISADQGANFRSDALHLIIMSTDAAFVEPDPPDTPPGQRNMSNDGTMQYPGPPWQLVKSWIRKKQVKIASIMLGEDAAPYLTRAAIDSGALAPLGGARCSAGVFIAEGKPLVCDATNYGDDPSNFSIGPAITGLVEALRDMRSLTYHVIGDTDILGAVPIVNETIDFKHDSTVPYALTLSCKDHPGNKHLTVVASSGSELIAQSTLDVVCEPKAPEEAGISITLLKGAAVAPVGQQPAPASNVNPQAAMGMVSQNEQQTAFQQSSTDQESMLMSAMPRKQQSALATQSSKRVKR